MAAAARCGELSVGTRKEGTGAMNTAKKLGNTETRLETGTVERILSGTIEVRHGTGTRQARRAKGCLVAPEIGDTVLCASTPTGAFVLAVLQGTEGAPTRLATEGDLRIESCDGRVAVSSLEGVDIVSAGVVTVASAEVHLRAGKGSIAVEELGFFGKLVQAQVAKVALAAEEVDSTVTRLTQRAKRIFRFVEEIDQTRAGTVDVRAQNLVGIRGENAVISARVLAKIDGEQIHIG
jgi:Protein of unknown function (DUF3540)